MAIEEHTILPSRLVAGDTYHWQDTPEDIDDVTGYEVVFRSVEESDISFSVTGTDQGTYFQFQLAESVTASLDGGDYSITKVITESGGRKSENAGKLVLLPNPSNDPQKTFAQRMVELLEKHIEGRLPEGLESHNIGGVPIQKLSFLDAQNLLDIWKSRVAHERGQRFARENPDKASGSTIKISF